MLVVKTLTNHSCLTLLTTCSANGLHNYCSTDERLRVRESNDRRASSSPSLTCILLSFFFHVNYTNQACIVLHNKKHWLSASLSLSLPHARYLIQVCRCLFFSLSDFWIINERSWESDDGGRDQSLFFRRASFCVRRVHSVNTHTQLKPKRTLNATQLQLRTFIFHSIFG